MASRTVSLGTPEIDILKETLRAQQELLQKLYNELDVERESSAVAADETLSMIIRLQGEKAAMEMEASQYKRIAEEKMFHAQETVEIFQELIYQKEMQIASLAFQVQSYRFKLASLGYDDLAPSEVQYPENMLSRKNNAGGSVVGDVSDLTFLRRGSSVPPLPNGPMSRRASTEGARTESPSPKKLLGKHTSLGDFNSYWEEIKKLDERVKEFTAVYDIPSSSALLPPPPLPPRPLSIYDPSPDNSPSVQDIFEVPQCPEDDELLIGSTSHENEKEKEKDDGFGSDRESMSMNMNMNMNNMNGKVNSRWSDVWKSNFNWEKQPLLLSQDAEQNTTAKSKNVVQEMSDSESKPLLSGSERSGSRSPRQLRDGKLENKLRLYKHPTCGVADFELQQFNRRLKQLEDDRFVSRREMSIEAGGEDQLKLLKDIMEKVEALQSEITNWRTKTQFPLSSSSSPYPLPPSSQDRSVGCFKEVMFCFLPK